MTNINEQQFYQQMQCTAVDKIETEQLIRQENCRKQHVALAS